MKLIKAERREKIKKNNRKMVVNGRSIFKLLEILNNKHERNKKKR